jgi:CDP-glucose 4,6-dehydratase
VDVRNRDGVVDSFQEAKPDVVIHMAAQALVREGYRDPIGTYETNVNGTLHVLQASDATDSVTSQLIVTTDKVYRDDGLRRPYVESDPLGGKDPYSASKAMADILAQEYFHNERTKPGAIARAGNVIGAGDSTKDRLLPDLGKAVIDKTDLDIRYPKSVRPWQHVLDCLLGYLEILGHFREHDQVAWNVGPETNQLATVEEVLRLAEGIIGQRFPRLNQRHAEWAEDQFLGLDTSASGRKLGISNRICLEDAVADALSEFLHEARWDPSNHLELMIRSFGGPERGAG